MASKNTKKQQVQANKNASALGKAAAVDLSQALNSLSQFGIKTQSTLASIQEELIQKHGELQAVDEAIRLKKQEMETLHGVDNVLLSIDDAKAQHAAELAKMEQEREDLKKQFTELKQQLETQRARDDEEYRYKLSLQRKTDTDAWNEQVRLRANDERDRKEKFEKDLAFREEVLKSKETAYQDALTKVANFDADVKKESDKNVAIATNALKKDYEHKIELTKVQHDSEVGKLKHDNERLIQAHNNLEAQLKEVQAQLKEAYTKNTELAAKAVEAGNNKQAQADALALVTNIGGNGTRPARS